MHTTREPSGASVFDVLFARSSSSARRRHWAAGRLYVAFDRTTLVDGESRKAVCVVSGTGIRPNAVFTAMEAAGRGAAWCAGTELTVARYAVQIEEAMHLHLLPYATVTDGEGGAASPAEGDGEEVALAAGAAAGGDVEEPRFGRKRPASVVIGGGGQLPRRRTTDQLARELQDAYPQFFL
ncbi:hypothetical protein DQ04_00751040 [Trypanosoma grayi]|uniref:hypothetical protein n=1 Tax=Trypanosoma grayi TaxID=71804 RepID=UPI0004F4A4F8|nr:hypothetical protein DQ04_00751040 [Trypanosoma grayi]KEG13844.1 hypothetical protein DQ04_00751040 [Trypanosoma grayi]